MQAFFEELIDGKAKKLSNPLFRTKTGGAINSILKLRIRSLNCLIIELNSGDLKAKVLLHKKNTLLELVFEIKER